MKPKLSEPYAFSTVRLAEYSPTLPSVTNGEVSLEVFGVAWEVGIQVKGVLIWVRSTLEERSVLGDLDVGGLSWNGEGGGSISHECWHLLHVRVVRVVDHSEVLESHNGTGSDISGMDIMISVLVVESVSLINKVVLVGSRSLLNGGV